jgi:hypothetical protein
MATQLRLVDPPPAPTPRPSRAGSRTRSAAARGTAATRTTTRARAVKGSTRRPAHWGDWQLDARTRQVGRSGVAAARAALQQAIDAETLPQAS